ncbi:MAG: ABC transporter ATP-binding protein [Bacteroidota bacterium]
MIIEHLTYRYKGATANAVNDISHTFEAGKIHGIIGPNGVGKTTLLSLMAGILKPDQGHITGFDELGILIQGIGMYDEANAIDNLKIFCEETNTSTENISYALSLVGIDEAQAQVKLKACSQGFKQRMLIARSITKCKGVIILDEPFTALDYDNIKLVSNGLSRLAKEKSATIIISSHRLQEVEKIIDYAIFINAGKIVNTTIANEEQNYLTITCAAPDRAARVLLKELPSMELERFKEGIVVQYANAQEYRKIVSFLLEDHIEWTGIEKSRSLTYAYDKFIKN